MAVLQSEVLNSKSRRGLAWEVALAMYRDQAQNDAPNLFLSLSFFFIEYQKDRAGSA